MYYRAGAWRALGYEQRSEYGVNITGEVFKGILCMQNQKLVNSHRSVQHKVSKSNYGRIRCGKMFDF